MTNLNDNVTVIIRSVGERTEQLCRELILAQGVSAENVVVVREAPFSAAMRKSFETGLQRGLTWTFCVDADLLLRSEAVETMLRLAEAQPENVCEIQGYILDKFFGGPRMGGVHLYRTEFLPLVLSSIPAEGVNVRPECHTLEAMKAQGYPFASVQYLVGLHDFEQYYSDIFRKSFVHAHKHAELAGILLPLWRKNAPKDCDFQVAISGFARGLEYPDDVYIDNRQQIYQDQFSKLNIVEKDDLGAGRYSTEDIERIIRSLDGSESFRASAVKFSYMPEQTKRTFFRRAVHRLGKIAMIIGNGLQSWAKSE